MARRASGDHATFQPWQAAVFLAGLTGLAVLAAPKRAPAPWRGLKTSPLVLPVWVLPAVWTGVNVLQVWADLRILNDKTAPDRRTLLALRAVNWGLYALFTPAVFRDKNPAGSEVLNLVEGVTAGATLALLARRDPTAAAAMAPLTLWNAYAALLGKTANKANPDGLVQRLRWNGAF